MKKKVIKDYRNLPENIREEIRDMYPNGFVHDMITFFDRDKHLISALPYDTEEISYLIKMPSSIHLDREEEEIRDPVESLSEETPLESLDNIDEEKFLIQEEEEEESD
jgi:hypothetical protein